MQGESDENLAFILLTGISNVIPQGLEKTLLNRGVVYSILM